MQTSDASSDTSKAKVLGSSDAPKETEVTDTGTGSSSSAKSTSEGSLDTVTDGNGSTPSGNQDDPQNQVGAGEGEQPENEENKVKGEGKSQDKPKDVSDPEANNLSSENGHTDPQALNVEGTGKAADEADQGDKVSEDDDTFEKNSDKSDDVGADSSEGKELEGNPEVTDKDEGAEQKDLVWVDPGVKKTARPGNASDQERAILYAKKDDEELKNSKGEKVEVLSTNGSKNKPNPTPQTISYVSIDGIGQEPPTENHPKYDGKAKTISQITKSTCNTAWLSPQNILLYANDGTTADGEIFKAGDKIVYTDPNTGKKYNLYFTDDNGGGNNNRNGYYDTALVIPEENTVNNIGEGLEISMTDWSGSKNEGEDSVQDTYIKQKLENGYKNGERINLHYDSTKVQSESVTLFNGKNKSNGEDIPGRETPSLRGILVDGKVGEVNAKFILLPDKNGSFPESGDLYYYGNYNGNADESEFLCYTPDESGSYGCVGKKTIDEIHTNSQGLKNYIIAVTCESNTDNIANTPVQYVKNESGVFCDRLEDDGYPKISEKYRNSTENGADSLGILFDYETNKYKFQEQEGKGTNSSGTYSNLDMPYFGVDNDSNHWDSYFLTNGLLQMDADGYWVYDSNQNFASLAPYGYQIYDKLDQSTNKYVTSATNGSIVRFMLFNETGTPDKDSDNADYHTGNFLPYDTLNISPDKKDHHNSANENQYEITKKSNPDYLFGMQVSGKFIQTPGGQFHGKDMIYEFSGDDDMVVYIDGKLALDLSGVHDAVKGEINFAKGTVTTYNNTQNAIDLLRFSTVIQQDKNDSVTKTFSDLNLTEKDARTFEDGSLHDIKIFYMERGRGASDLKLKLNLQTAPVNTVASSVTKTWNDGSMDHNTDEVEVMLESSDDGGKTYKQFDLNKSTDEMDGAKLNKGNNWTYSANKLPHYVTIKADETVAPENRYKFDETKGEYIQDNNGNLKEIKYRWVEKTKSNDDPSSPKYSSSSTEENPGEPDKSSEDKKTGILSQLFNIVNTLLGKSTVEQKWVDADNKFNTQPDQVSMTLESSTDGEHWQTYDANPDTAKPDTITASLKKGSWQASYDLPKYDRNGNEIYYRWNDDNSTVKKDKGYRVATIVSPENNLLDQSYTIVNTLQAVTSVEKTWDDACDKDGVRPDSIELTLHKVDAKGNDSVVKTVEVTRDKNWTHSETVDRADENGELKYYWTEGSIPGYRQSEYAKYALGDDSLDEKTTITNSHRHIPVYDPSYPVPQPTPFKEDEPEKNDDPETKPEDVTPNPAEDTETKDDEITDNKTVIPETKNDDSSKPSVTTVQPEERAAVPQTTAVTAQTETKTVDTVSTKAEDDKSDAVKADNVETADAGNVAGNAAAMAVSAAGLGIWAFLTRRRKHSKG